MRCWTRLVRPRSPSPHEMAFPYLRIRLRRVRRFCAEHSALSTRARSHAPSSPLSFPGLSPTVSSRDTSRGLAVIQVHPMPGCVAWDGSWAIRTLEPSVMVISPACQSISLTYRSRKLVPRIPGTTRLSTMATWRRPLQLPNCSGNVPWPQRRTRRPSPSRMEPPAASRGSPPVDSCQIESGTTETTAPLSRRREISSPFSLPATDGACPAWSSVIAKRRRSPCPLFRACAGRVRVRSWGQSRRRWSRLPQRKHPGAVLGGRGAARSSCSILLARLPISFIMASIFSAISDFSVFATPARGCGFSW
ncbi:hypothetical protein T08_3734 [Trichinella sp. T8]|nr:hypothetical protein T08_3734 [Trichinella sp. T8]